MKTCLAILVALVACAQGFSPVSQQGARASTELNSLFDRVTGMDLFTREKSFYGAREQKNLKQGKIEAGKSYVPAGLSAAEYQKFRETEAKKKRDNYERNVKKAGVFTDYTDFYLKRGTDTSQAWAKNKNTLGHTFAKTKYDWSGKFADRRTSRAEAAKKGGKK
mmetsp:Transcript_1417/g.3138  ORF Transcript_1417/g.3138 Transcript_1417/m.3138 type:complete len:164 (-) Transcript_1417:98-589(-)